MGNQIELFASPIEFPSGSKYLPKRTPGPNITGMTLGECLGIFKELVYRFRFHSVPGSIIWNAHSMNDQM